MTKSNVMLKGFIFLFLMFLIASPKFLHAQQAKQFTVSAAEGDCEYVLMVEREERFEILERGTATLGKALPAEYCTVCVPVDAIVTLRDQSGKEIELFGPDVYDLWVEGHRPYQKEEVKVTEGLVEVQSVITVDGKTKPVGPPILVLKGSSVLTDACFRAVKTQIARTLDEAAEEAQSAQEIAALLAEETEEEGDEAETEVDEKETSPSS